jgi:murein DD-endopeptidase MepM/ murein hydrolase activator NlpD
MGRVTTTLALTALLVACGTEPPPLTTAGVDVHLAPDTRVASGLVPPGSTLEAMLVEQGLRSDVVHGVVEAVRAVFDPRRLRSLQPFSLEQSLDGALRLFEYEIDAVSFLRVSPSVTGPDALRAEVVPIPTTLEHDSVSGRIDEATPSLFQSIEVAGERPDLAIAMAQIFSGEIDFNTELQPGDRFTVAFERLQRDGRPASYGAINAAEFQNDGRVVRAIRFTPAGGQPGYYDERGRSLRRFFLRSPLKFEPRITSGFSSRRMHPVLHEARAHRGVDYGAPAGAEVVSVAAGRVVSATVDASNGRMVRVRHGSGYVSQYLHLSAFGAGIRAGAAVAQGQTIGRVGATGLATGPHLHYGLQKNGAYVNPLREHRNMPPGEPVPASDLTTFGIERDRALAVFAGQSGSSSSADALAQ